MSSIVKQCKNFKGINTVINDDNWTLVPEIK